MKLKNFLSMLIVVIILSALIFSARIIVYMTLPRFLVLLILLGALLILVSDSGDRYR